jgi:hypothetical protein
MTQISHKKRVKLSNGLLLNVSYTRQDNLIVLKSRGRKPIEIRPRKRKVDASPSFVASVDFGSTETVRVFGATQELVARKLMNKVWS